MPHKHHSRSNLTHGKQSYHCISGCFCFCFIFELYNEDHLLSNIRRMNTSAQGIISMFIITFIPPRIILKMFRSQALITIQYENIFSTTGIRNINCMHFSNSYQEILPQVCKY